MVRTRFAPSPTGYLHIGGLRTALYSYLFAKKHDGQFILRVEDTDQKRYVEGAIEAITRGMHWAGVLYDEGPDNGGPYAPYIQSQRKDKYLPYALSLIEKGHAYYCFCTPERLQQMREEQQQKHLPPKYDRHCLVLSEEEKKTRLQNGEAHVIRMKVPDNRELVLEDLVKGPVSFNTKDVDDQVLIKSDGLPTYQLAVVIDDHLMEISHVIRAEEWLPSSPKQMLLFEYFGWQLPHFAHVSDVLAPGGGGKKLSKRDGAVSLDEFAAQGYLPDATMNYIAFVGWNPGTTQEFFSMPELIEAFSLERCQKAGAIFDYKRLNWMNGQYIRKKNVQELSALLKPFLQDQSWYREDDAFLEKAAVEVQARMETLVQGREMLESFYTRVDYAKDLILNEKMKVSEPIGQTSLKLILEKLTLQEIWEKESLQQTLQQIVAQNGLTNGQVFWPLRAVLSGKPASPGAFEMAYVLGKTETLARIEQGLSKMGK